MAKLHVRSRFKVGREANRRLLLADALEAQGQGGNTSKSFHIYSPVDRDNATAW